MNKTNTTVNRRKVLKSFAVGSSTVAAGTALPNEWIKPIVSQVILPAHAQTTDANAAASSGVTTTSSPTTTQAAPTTLKFFVTSF